MNKELVEIEENQGLSRDVDSGAVVNTDTQQFEEYKRKKAEKIKTEDRLSALENNVDQIKTMLEQLLNGNTSN